MTELQIDALWADVDKTLTLFDRLRETKTEIARLRRHNLHLTAGIARDDLLSDIERWLDPAGLDHRNELQAIQGRAAVALALDIDPDLGF